MEQHIRTYTGEKSMSRMRSSVVFMWPNACKRLHAVFDTSRRPWVLPDAASPDNVTTTVVACPSGALHYERKDGGASESIEAHNTIRLIRNGPLHVRGDFTITNGVGDLVLNDTRAALCRCGGSANKPFCDNTHKAIGFVAPDTVAEPQSLIETSAGGKLCIGTATNGPLKITGNFTVLNNKGEAVYQGTDDWFCRCGGSANKPFCDDTHKKFGFVAE